MNHAYESGRRVYALDIPTGIDPKTGSPFDDIYVKIHGCFSFGKPKSIAYRNADFGALINIDIGFDLLAPVPVAIIIKIDLQQWWPVERDSNAKWNRGHVAIIARGGAAFVAHAAFLAGAGLVSIVCSQEEWNGLHGLRP